MSCDAIRCCWQRLRSPANERFDYSAPGILPSLDLQAREFPRPAPLQNKCFWELAIGMESGRLLESARALELVRQSQQPGFIEVTRKDLHSHRQSGVLHGPAGNRDARDPGEA